MSSSEDPHLTVSSQERAPGSPRAASLSEPRAPSFAELTSLARLWDAWGHVEARGAAAGVDRESVEAFGAQAESRIEHLAEALAARRYRPRPARRLALDDEPARPIAVSCVRDRIVQRAVASGLAPFYEHLLPRAVLAYRPGVGVEDALRETERHLARGRRWFLRTDVEKFFDRIDRQLLCAGLRNDGLDDRTIELVAVLLAAGVSEGAAVFEPGLGAPQGSSLSPLLSNAYLRGLDDRMLDASFAYLRYADDILVLAEREAELSDARSLLEAELTGLSLNLSARKTRVGHLGGGFDYLGVRFDSGGRAMAAAALGRLGERARAVAARPLELSALCRSWMQFYGPVPRGQRAPAPVVAAAALVAAEGGDRVSLEEWAGERASGDDGRELGAATHLRLVAAWSTLTSERGDLALVLDARAAIVCGLDPHERRELARMVGLEDAQLELLGGPPSRAAATLAAAGRVTLADAARRLGAGARALPRADASAMPTVDEDQVEALLKCLGGHETMHLEEKEDGRGHHRLMSTDGALAVGDLGAHLEGRMRRGVYLVRADGAVRFATLEVRARRDVMAVPDSGGGVQGHERWAALAALAHDHAMAVSRACGRLGLPVGVEDSGDHGRRIWVLFESAVPVRHAFALLARVEEEVGAPPPELIRMRTPAIDVVRKRPGPMVLLPLGRDPRSGRMSTVLDPRGHPVADGVAAFLGLRRVSADMVRAMVVRGSVEPPAGSADVRADSRLQTIPGAPAAETVLRGCSVMRALAGKARRLGLLEGDERRTLLEVLGHLPREQRAKALATILEPTGEGVRRVERALAELSGNPLGCTGIRRRHGALTVEVGCECTFPGLEGRAYPTPVLHALKPREVEAFRSEDAQRRHEPSARPGRGRGPAQGRGEQRPTAAGPVPAREGRPRVGGHRTTPASTREASQPGPGPAVPRAALPETFDTALDKVLNRRAQIADATRGLQRAEAVLGELFDRAGTDRVRIRTGWLVREKQEDGTSRFSVQLSSGSAPEPTR